MLRVILWSNCLALESRHSNIRDHCLALPASTLLSKAQLRAAMKSVLLWGAFEQPLHDCLLEELRSGSEFELQVVHPSSGADEPEQILQSLPVAAAETVESVEARFNGEELRELRGADIILYQLTQTESEREEFANILRGAF